MSLSMCVIETDPHAWGMYVCAVVNKTFIHVCVPFSELINLLSNINFGH